MNRRACLTALAALFGCAAGAAKAASGSVLVIPIATNRKGAPENAKLLTAAVRESLEKHGFSPISATESNRLIRDEQIDASLPIPLPTLVRLQERAHAKYVVFVRILTLGLSEDEEYQANVLINVLGENPRTFLHTRQVGQVFKPVNPPQPTDPRPLSPVRWDERAAEEAAGKLLDGFYAATR